MFRLTLLMVVFFTCAHAKEVGLLRVHCDPEFDSVHDFYLSLDDSDHVFSMTRRSQRSQNCFFNHELQSKELVIASHKDKKVILISCPAYNPKTGGPFVIKYLYNGLTNSYKSMNLWLEKDEKGWQLTTPPPKKIKICALKVVPRKFAGVTIGIQHLQVIH